MLGIFIFTILDAFAETKTYVGVDNSDWDVADNWDPQGVPDQDDDIEINPGPGDPPPALRVNIFSDVTIGPSGSITTDNGATVRAVNPGSLTIQGTYTMNHETDALVARGGTIENDCTGIITLAEGVMFTQTFSGNGGTIINHGTITGTRQGGSTNQDNSIFLLSGGLLQNSGTLPSAILVNDGATFETIPSICPIGGNGGIGGKLLPIDTTDLLLAGVQTNLAWIVPVVLSAVGIGIFVIRRK